MPGCARGLFWPGVFLTRPCIALAPDDESFRSGIRAQYAPSPERIGLENGCFGMPANPVRAALRRCQEMVVRLATSDPLARTSVTRFMWGQAPDGLQVGLYRITAPAMRSPAA